MLLRLPPRAPLIRNVPLCAPWTFCLSETPSLPVVTHVDAPECDGTA